MPALVPRFWLTRNLPEFYSNFGTQTGSRRCGFLGKIWSINFLILSIKDSQRKFYQDRWNALFKFCLAARVLEFTRITWILLEIELVGRAGVSRGRKISHKSQACILNLLRAQFYDHPITDGDARARFRAPDEITDSGCSQEAKLI